MSERTVRVALVGCGRWGLRLGSALARLPGVEVAALVDRDPCALAAAAATAPGALRFPELGALCASGPTLDAAIVATPSPLHARHGLALLRAGLDVLVEKPLATTLAAARTLASEARRLGRVGMAGHVLRYHPGFERLIELGRSGALGRLRGLWARRLTRSGSTSPLWTLAPHDLATLHALDPSVVRRVELARCASGPAEPTAPIELRVELASGLEATLVLSTDAAVAERLTRLTGSEGAAWLDELALDAPLLCAAATGGPTRPVAVERGEPLLRELEPFASSVRYRTEPRTSFAEALFTVDVLERAERALEAARAPLSDGPAPP
ncbi:MAG: Gfo/Idh/MocA family oxidoreductase [Polyangiaceae bacterium]|nr:Gfo/Idh/MocA family oxidoreductase [Polyangiaceae bacterium]